MMMHTSKMGQSATANTNWLLFVGRVDGVETAVLLILKEKMYLGTRINDES